MQSSTGRPAGRRSSPPGVAQTGPRGGCSPPRVAASPPAPPHRRHPPALSSWHRSYLPPSGSLPNGCGTLQGSLGGNGPHPRGSPVPPQPWGSRHPSGCSRARSLPPRTPLRLLALRGARGWAVRTASPNSPWTATAEPAIKLGTSHSQCFSNCSTHARHARCCFNVSWMHVAAPHRPSRTRAPSTSAAGDSPASPRIVRAKTDGRRKWKSQFAMGAQMKRLSHCFL